MTDAPATSPSTRTAWLTPTAARLVGGTLLALAAVVPLRAGSSLPPWLPRLGDVAGIGGEHAARWMTAALATTALTALFWPTMLGPATAGTAIAVGGVLLAFAGIATVGAASAVSAATLIGGLLAGAVGGLCVLWLAGAATPSRDPSQAPRGASPAWQVLGAMALFALALGVAARVPVRPTEALVSVSSFETHNPAAPNESVEMISFEFDAWVGRPLADTGLYGYLPELAALVREGTVFLVFYNPRCGHCHELFEAHFAGSLTLPVIAIEIPPPPGGTLVETDEPTEIQCPECQRLSLPTTNAWGVTPPAVVRIEDGIVRCAGEANALTPTDCIGAITTTLPASGQR